MGVLGGVVGRNLKCKVHGGGVGLFKWSMGGVGIYLHPPFPPLALGRRVNWRQAEIKGNANGFFHNNTLCPAMAYGVPAPLVYCVGRLVRSIILLKSLYETIRILDRFVNGSLRKDHVLAKVD